METKIYNLKQVLAANISLNDDNVEYEIVCDFKDEKILENIKEFKEKNNDFKNIKISINCYEDYLYEQNDINKLIDINSECKSLNCKTDIHLNDASGDMFNILLARRKIENFTENLKSLTTTNEQGQQVPLSPLEKYFVVFKFVANRVYNKSENFDDDRMRNWVGVLTSDQVICSGFASLLKCVCDRVFDKNELICYKQSVLCLENGENKDFEGHANNLILVNDPKYNIRGLFTSDACWSSASERNNMSSSFEFCLNPLSMYGNLNGLEVLFHDKENPIYKHIDNILSDEETLVEKIYNQNFVKDIGVIFRNDILKQGKDNLYKNILSQLSQEQIEAARAARAKWARALIKENNLQFLSQIQIPYYVIPTLSNNCPGIEKYYDIIKNINIENLEESMPKLKEFEEFYNKNKEVFDYVEEISKEKSYYDRVYSSVESTITNNCKNNSTNYEIQYEQAEKETQNIIDEEVKNIAENNKEFFNPPEISDEVKRECLRAVDSYVRYTSDEVDYDTEDYLDWEMERLKQKKEEAFNCRQAEERIQREKAKDLSF